MKTAGLNRSYRLVWSEVHQAFVAVAEVARSRGKGSAKAAVVLATVSLTALGALSALGTSTAMAQSLPTGGSVVAGSGSIAQTGQTLTVTQTSGKLAADWQSLSIGQGHTVNFVQPSASAVALNRVLGADVSVIQGALNANGQVFLVNPNGVLFTPTAQVNVGALAVSTLNLSTDDFLAGNYRFSGSSVAGIKNEGDIQVGTGGTVALIAARIENTGSITAPQGNVLLGAGSKVRLDLGGPVKIEVEEGALNTLIEQGGAIRADGGLVYLTAKAAGDLASSVINHTGITEARTLATGQKGEVLLMGDMARGTVNVGGRLEASAAANNPGSQGGFIETSAHNVKIVDGAQVKAGHWLIDPTDITIDSAAATTLQGQLSGGDATVQTLLAGTGNGDITVNSAVTWNAASKLTLSAHRNIAINADITASNANGKVQLEYGQAAAAAGNTADYRFGGGKINLKAGDNFATKVGSDGALTPWKVITSLGNAIDAGTASNFTLQGLAHSRNLGGNYVLGADIDAAGTSGWNGTKGFKPIGKDSKGFTGSVDGLNHTIKGLVINRPTEEYIGLFGVVENAAIRNIGLEGGSAKGDSFVGSLVGNVISSKLSNTHANVNVNGVSLVGGLAGSMQSATINNSYATGAVAATASRVGGLIGGAGSSSEISNSWGRLRKRNLKYVKALAAAVAA